MQKTISLLILSLLLSLTAIAQESIHDLFKLLDDSDVELLQNKVDAAQTQIDKDFHLVLYSMSNPQVVQSTENIASSSTNSIYLVINFAELYENEAYVFISPDLSDTYPEEFLAEVADEVMMSELDFIPQEGEVKLAFIAGIDAFLNAKTPVTFTAHDEQNYGFDHYDNTPALEDDYPLLEALEDTPYRIAWKSLPTLGFDKAITEMKDGSLIPDNIQWKDENGIVIAATDVLDSEGTQKQLFLSGSAGNTDTKEIHAIQSSENDYGQSEEQVVGQLNLISYDEKDLNIVLVPVNTATVSNALSLANDLQDIFDPAIINVHLTLHDGISVSDFDDTMDDEDSGFLADYTDEMQDIISTFKRNNNITNKTYYLFVVQDAEDPNLEGFMPRNRKYGFLFEYNIGGDEAFVRTVAHELGHGAYHLEHPFEEYAGSDEGLSENLMNYGSGTRLRKYQWDYMDDPVFVLPWSGDDEEGASLSDLPCIMPEDGYITTPDDVVIYIPEGTPVSFFPDWNEPRRDGKLFALNSEEDTYVATFSDNGVFLGYGNSGNNYFTSTQNVLVPANKYFFGATQSYQGRCRCILFPYYGNIAVTDDGTGEYNVPNGYPAEFPDPNYPNSSQIILLDISSEFCGHSNEETINSTLGELSGTIQDVQQQINLLFDGGGVLEGCWLLYDNESRVLIQYMSGSNQALTYTGNEAHNIVAQYKNGQYPEACGDFIVLIESPTSGQLIFDIQFNSGYLNVGQKYLDILGAKPYSEEDASTQLKEIIREKLDNLENINSNALYEYAPISEYPEDGNLNIHEAKVIPWISFTVDEVSHLIREVELNKGLWKPDEQNYDDKLLNVYAPVAGISDQLIMEVKDMKETVELAGKFCSDPRGSIESIYEFTSNLSVDDVKKMVSEGVSQEIDILTTPGPQRQYKMGEYSTAAVMLIFAFTKEGSELILEFTENVSGSVDEIRDFVAKFADELGVEYQRLTPKKKEAFFEDFGDWTQEHLDEFNGNRGKVNAWDDLFTLNAHPSLRKNPTFLEDFVGVRPKHVPSGPMVGKKIGHTFTKHGSHNTKTLTYQAVNGTTPIGQWLDDIAAEDFIARHLSQLGQGARDIPIPNSVGGIGRVFKSGTGEIVEVTHIRLIPSGSGVDTAFPINAGLVSLNPLGTYVP